MATKMTDREEETANLIEVVDNALGKRRELYQHISNHDKELSFFTRNIYCLPQFATLPVVTLLSVYLVTFYESLGANFADIGFFIALGR